MTCEHKWRKIRRDIITNLADRFPAELLDADVIQAVDLSWECEGCKEQRNGIEITLKYFYAPKMIEGPK